MPKKAGKLMIKKYIQPKRVSSVYKSSSTTSNKQAQSSQKELKQTLKEIPHKQMNFLSLQKHIWWLNVKDNVSI